MEKEVVLSRLNIVSKVDMDTPLCVLEEILDAHRVGHQKGVIRENYRMEILNYIDKLQSIVVQPPFGLSQLRILTAYINTDKKLLWTKKKLFESLQFLQKFDKSSTVNLDMIDPDFEWGAQTPDNPNKLNACVLFKICQENGLQTQVQTTVEEMAHCVRFLKAGPDQIYQLLNHFTQISTTHNIINSLILGNPSKSIIHDIPTEETLNYTSLNQYIDITPYVNSLSTPLELVKIVHPMSITEAVALAALFFKKDISLSAYPISEYRRLQITYYGYIPYDDTLRKIHILNPLLLDLTKTFNPLFPEQYYRSEDLLQMAVQEGYTIEELHGVNVYETLQVSQLLDNFYPGIYPEIVNEETPVTLDEVSELNPGMIICYGVRRERLTAFNIEGLVDHFRIIKTFAHPTDVGVTFTPQNIKKLKCIASDTLSGTETSQRLKRELVAVIEEVEFLSDETLSKAKELYQCFQGSSEIVKQQIHRSIRELLHLSMYMRGWEGEGYSFPIIEAPVDDQLSVDMKVTESIQEFENLCSELEEIGNLIINLPLLRYQGEFNPSYSERDGYTVGDRIRIVKRGDETGNIASCIRLTSNWLAASAYRYLTLIGEPPPFPVDELRYIS